jgi:hypothetical protein
VDVGAAKTGRSLLDKSASRLKTETTANLRANHPGSRYAPKAQAVGSARPDVDVLTDAQTSAAIKTIVASNLKLNQRHAMSGAQNPVLKHVLKRNRRHVMSGAQAPLLKHVLKRDQNSNQISSQTPGSDAIAEQMIVSFKKNMTKS